VASAVGFIALAGVAAEFGVVMLLFVRNAWDEVVANGRTGSADLVGAIRHGAVLRVRPKAMTVAVILGDGRRHDYGAAAVAVRDSCRVFAASSIPRDD
jgi:hypothetical protein